MVFKENFYVGYSDINKDCELSNVSILRFFENVACMHASLAKDGFYDTESKWFLTAYHVELKSRPKYEKRVNVHTWSRDFKGIQACREFEILDEEGNLLGSAISNWARINMKTQRLERITEALAEAYGNEPEKTNFDSLWIEKIKEPESFDFEKDYFIGRNYIDTNNHMNNVYYMELANFVLPDEVYALPECKSFEINYKKAIPFGVNVKCLFTDTPEAYYVTIKNEAKTETHAIIKMNK